jgi:hypothetical protein
MSKRKPPSKRQERKLDDTAKAIARSREDAKAEKPDEPQRPEGTTSFLGRLVKSIAPGKVTGPAPSPSTKRPKKV